MYMSHVLFLMLYPIVDYKGYVNGISSQSQVSLEQEGRRGGFHATFQRGISYQSSFNKKLEEGHLSCIFCQDW